MEQKKYDLSENHLKKAAHLFTQDSSTLPEYENKVLMEMGILNRKQRQSNEAINYYLLALDGFEKIKDSVGVAKTHSNLGNVYYDIKENAIARYHYRLAYQGYQASYGFRKALALEGIALTYRKERAFSLAVENLMTALGLIKESFGQEHYYTKKIVRKIAQDYNNMGEYQRAADILLNEKALTGNALGLQVMAECQLKLGNLKDAENYVMRGLKTPGINLLDSIFNIKTLADIKLAKGQIDEAEKLYLLNIEQRKRYYPVDDEKIQQAHYAIAKLEYEKGEVKKSLSILDTLLNSPHNMFLKLENGSEIRSSLWDDVMRKKCRILYAQYLENSSDQQWQATFKAANTYLKAFEMLKKNAAAISSQATIDGRPTEIIEIILNLLYDHYKAGFDQVLVGEALLKMDHMRDMLWVDLIQNRQTVDVTPSQLKLVQNENILRKRIASLDLSMQFNPDSSQLKIQMIELKNDLMALTSRRPALTQNTLSTGQKVLDELRKMKGQTLSYFVTDQNMYRIFVSRDTTMFEKLEWDAASRQLVETVTINIASQLNLTQIELEKLSQLLLDGLPLLSGQNLMIYPDDILHTFPFEILSDPQDQQFLVLKYPIVYSTSLKKLFYPYQTKSFENNLVAFAPNYQEWSIDYADTVNNKVMAALVRDGMTNLPATKSEVNNINSLVEGKVFADEGATVERFIQYSGSSRILHLSMHALAEFTQPILSRLVFSSNNDEGQISRYRFAGEIAEQDIPAELVVLSACNTGRGEFRRGDGVLSLARAFEYAGAQSTLYSLWKIPDAATGELMESFYRNLTKGLNKSDALQQAKLSYLAKHKNTKLDHPYYWAGFVLSGNYNKINLSHDSSPYWIVGALLLAGFAFLFYTFVFQSKAKVE
jgi:CHAT domain-containing protein